MLNQDPGLLAAAVLRAPFLDPLTSMLDQSLPLTTEEVEEWGDPTTCEATRRAMAAYSPYAGLRRQRYPAMLLVAAEHDVRVPFTQALRYVACVRHCTVAPEGDVDHGDPPPPQLLHLRESGGHLDEGGRFRRLELSSMEAVFLMHAVGATCTV
uniref:Prolyl endopeptidase-like n=1 Tax=Haptolina brevifila TaxID=156173 RepID=A0A7S2C7W6_9EUKA